VDRMFVIHIRKGKHSDKKQSIRFWALQPTTSYFTQLDQVCLDDRSFGLGEDLHLLSGLCIAHLH